MSTTYTASAAKSAAYVLPSDGDSQSAAGVNSVFEALADGLKWCFDAFAPSQSAPKMQYTSDSSATGTPVAYSMAATFEASAGTGSLDFYGGGTSGMTSSSADDFFVSSSFRVQGATTGAEVRLAYSADGGTVTEVPGARAQFDTLPATGGLPCTLVGAFGPGTATSLTFYLQVRGLTGGATVSVASPWTFQASQVRYLP